MSGRISALKNQIAALRVQIIGLKMTPTNEYLESLKNEILSLKQEGQCKQVTIDSLADKLCKANEEVKHRFSSKYVETLDKYIVNLKQEVKSKQITIDSLEFDVDRTEKRLISADEIIIKSGKDIELLKLREQCSKDNISDLVDRIYEADRGLKEANEKMARYIQITEGKKIKNRLKKLLAG